MSLVCAVVLAGGLTLGQRVVVSSPTTSGYGRSPDLASMFDKTSWDYGNVPHGSQTSHRFKLTNNTGADLQLQSVRSTCRCATPKIISQNAKPGEPIEIEVTYDARTFVGERKMVIYADFNVGQVAINVKGYSRQDVILEPGQVELGLVKPGKEQRQTLRLEYAGALDWKVTDVVPGKWSVAKVTEKERSNGRVRYEVDLVVNKDAPRGLLVDAVQLKTNDPSSPIVQVGVNGQIEAGLTASPSAVDFGEAKVGQKTSQRVIVKNDQPFSVETAMFQTKGLAVNASQGDRTVHLVELNFTPTAAGKVNETLKIKVQPSGDTVDVKVSANVK